MFCSDIISVFSSFFFFISFLTSKQGFVYLFYVSSCISNTSGWSIFILIALRKPSETRTGICKSRHTVKEMIQGGRRKVRKEVLQEGRKRSIGGVFYI